MTKRKLKDQQGGLGERAEYQWKTGTDLTYCYRYRPNVYRLARRLEQLADKGCHEPGDQPQRLRELAEQLEHYASTCDLRSLRPFQTIARAQRIIKDWGTKKPGGIICEGVQKRFSFPYPPVKPKEKSSLSRKKRK